VSILHIVHSIIFLHLAHRSVRSDYRSDKAENCVVERTAITCVWGKKSRYICEWSSSVYGLQHWWQAPEMAWTIVFSKVNIPRLMITRYPNEKLWSVLKLFGRVGNL